MSLLIRAVQMNFVLCLLTFSSPLLPFRLVVVLQCWMCVVDFKGISSIKSYCCVLNTLMLYAIPTGEPKWRRRCRCRQNHELTHCQERGTCYKTTIHTLFHSFFEAPFLNTVILNRCVTGSFTASALYIDPSVFFLLSPPPLSVCFSSTGLSRCAGWSGGVLCKVQKLVSRNICSFVVLINYSHETLHGPIHHA